MLRDCRIYYAQIPLEYAQNIGIPKFKATRSRDETFLPAPAPGLREEIVQKRTGSENSTMDRNIRKQRPNKKWRTHPQKHLPKQPTGSVGWVQQGSGQPPGIENNKLWCEYNTHQVARQYSRTFQSEQLRTRSKSSKESALLHVR